MRSTSRASRSTRGARGQLTSPQDRTQPSCLLTTSPPSCRQSGLIGPMYGLRPGVPRADIANAMAIVEVVMQMSPRSVALAEVTKCFALTKSRDHEDMDIQATLAGM